MSKLRILIADDHALVRMGISALISAQDDMTVVGQAKNGAEAVAEALRLKPDVVLMDLVMPVKDGIVATGEIKSALPDAQVIILTSYTTTDSIAQALDNGARGAVFKSDANSELLTAIHTVANGGQFVSPAIQRQIESDPPIPRLTPRQRQAIEYITRGLTNSDIARLDGCSESAVKKLLISTFAKLGVANRTEAVAIALRKQLVKI